MVTAEDGAYLRVRFEPGNRRVIVHCVVQLDLDHMTQREPYPPRYCADIGAARDFALDIARARNLPILWEESTFDAEVYHSGPQGWLGKWTIRHGGYPLEDDATFYRTEETARSMVEADAKEHGHDKHVVWHNEPAPAA